MEIVGADNDFGLAVGDTLDLVSPLARRFDSGLDSLGAGVHGQGHVEAGQFVQVFIEQRQLVVAEGARGERHLVSLLDQSLQDAGMAVPLIHRGIGCQAVEVALALDVVDPHAFGTFNDDIERVIVVSTELLFQIDELLGAGGIDYCVWHGRDSSRVFSSQ